MTYAHNDYAHEFKNRAGTTWKTAVAFAAGKGPSPEAPYQVELHLASPSKPACCLLRCVDCHGQFLRRPSRLRAQAYLDLLDDVQEMGVQSVVYSGAYSDPALDEELLVNALWRSGPVYGVKLHAYGLGMTENVREAVVDAAKRCPEDSYATFSKVTVDADTYDRMCRPTSLSAESALRTEEENLLEFFELASQENYPLAISLNCRITKINGSVKQLADLLRWFAKTPAPIRMRFTTDYVPTRSTDAFKQRFMDEIYVAPRDASEAVWHAAMRSGCPMERLSLRETVMEPQYDGPTCYNSLLLSAVDTNGGVFPCQSLASPLNRRLMYGSLHEKRFPEIWSDYITGFHTMSPIADGRCPHCTASCEQQINLAVQKEVRDA